MKSILTLFLVSFIFSQEENLTFQDLYYGLPNYGNLISANYLRIGSLLKNKSPFEISHSKASLIGKFNVDKFNLLAETSKSMSGIPDINYYFLNGNFRPNSNVYFKSLYSVVEQYSPISLSYADRKFVQTEYFGQFAFTSDDSNLDQEQLNLRMSGFKEYLLRSDELIIDLNYTNFNQKLESDNIFTELNHESKSSLYNFSIAKNINNLIVSANYLNLNFDGNPSKIFNFNFIYSENNFKPGLSIQRIVDDNENGQTWYNFSILSIDGETNVDENIYKNNFYNNLIKPNSSNITKIQVSLYKEDDRHGREYESEYNVYLRSVYSFSENVSSDIFITFNTIENKRTNGTALQYKLGMNYVSGQTSEFNKFNQISTVLNEKQFLLNLTYSKFEYLRSFLLIENIKDFDLKIVGTEFLRTELKGNLNLKLLYGLTSDVTFGFNFDPDSYFALDATIVADQISLDLGYLQQKNSFSDYTPEILRLAASFVF